MIDSRDISYAFTNLMANDYYAFSENRLLPRLRNAFADFAESYDNHCLFSQISSSTKKKDDFAFWIFFTFKGKLPLYGHDALRSQGSDVRAV